MKVVEAARRRIRYIIERFEGEVTVSVSGGKDSGVLLHLVLAVAEEMQAGPVRAMFIDQGAEYADTIDLMRRYADDPRIDLQWLQLPLRMTNVCSYRALFLHAWGPDFPLREPEPGSIRHIDGAPDRFYPLIEFMEQHLSRTAPHAFFVGLRSEEAPERWRATHKHPGIDGLTWTTRRKGQAFTAYPLFDWRVRDVWRYTHEHAVPYNPVYDALHWMGVPLHKQRVSSLHHEKSHRSLATLQQIEPGTYDALVQHLDGVHLFATQNDTELVDRLALPDGYRSWKQWRDVLLESVQPVMLRQKLAERFDKQPDTPDSHKMQCKAILMNDWGGYFRPDSYTPKMRRKKAARLRNLL